MIFQEKQKIVNAKFVKIKGNMGEKVHFMESILEIMNFQTYFNTAIILYQAILTYICTT